MAESVFIPRLRLTFDAAKLAAAGEELKEIPDGLPKAIAGAINKAIPQGRTRLIKVTTGILNLLAREVRARMSIKKATKTKLEGSLIIGKKRVELIEYRPTQNKTGVRVRMFKDRPPELLPRFFINKGRSSGQRHVMRRVEGEGGELVPRYPIRIRYGQSVYGLMQERREVLEDETKNISVDMGRQLDSQVDRLLMRRKIEE